MRNGVVTGNDFGKTMPGQSFVYYTTIPVPPGMSGSPVLVQPEVGGPMVVCGVVSSDLSPKEAYSSFLQPGRSAISMLWPSIGLGLVGAPENSDAEQYFSIADMITTKFVDDRTVSAKVSISQSKTATRIYYEDIVHGKALLTGIGHPLAADDP
jgi:hypothetical protein